MARRTDNVRLELVTTEAQRWHWRNTVAAFHAFKPDWRHIGRRIDWLIYLGGELVGAIGVGSTHLALPKAIRDYIGAKGKEFHQWHVAEWLRHRCLAANYKFCLVDDLPLNVGSMALRLLSILAPREWKRKYGDELALIITFVDGREGTVYRAAGWDYLGKTKGKTTRVFHSKLSERWAGPHSFTTDGSAKLVFAKPLRADFKEYLVARSNPPPPLLVHSKPLNTLSFTYYLRICMGTTARTFYRAELAKVYREAGSIERAAAVVGISPRVFRELLLEARLPIQKPGQQPYRVVP